MEKNKLKLLIMYNEILIGLFEQNKIISEDQKVSYLKSLQDPALKLWNSYRNNYFYVDYTSRKIRDAYMLRYFPSYSDLIYTELKAKNHLINFTKTNITCTLIGSGPCPEAVGIIKYINEYHNETSNINFISLDKIAKGWEHTRNITLNYLIPSIQNDLKFKLNCGDFDITNPISSYNAGSLKTFNELISNSNFIIFQNFLNETNLRKNKHNVYNNIVHIYNRLSKGSFIIFNEVSGYDIEVCNLLIEIQLKLQSLNPKYVVEPFCLSDPVFEGSTLAPPLNSKHYKINDLNSKVPEILWSNFFNINLLPKKNIDYESLILMR